MTVVSERVASTPSRTATFDLRASVPAVALALDTAVVSLAAVIAVLGRENISLFMHQSNFRSTLGVIVPIAIAGWIVSIGLSRGYRHDLFGAGTDEYKRVAHASLYAAAALGIGCYLTNFQLARGFYFLFFGIGVPGLLAGRLVLRRALGHARRRGVLTQRVLITGSPCHVDEVASVLRREPWLGYEVVGALTSGDSPELQTPGGVPVLGDVGDVAVAVHEDVDVVFFAGGSHTSAHEMRRVIWELEGQAVRMIMAPNVADISRDRIRMRPVGGLPLVHIDPPTWSDASRLGKRTFDVLGSLLILLLASPLLAATALWIRLHDGGPIMFRHSRIGRDGAPFDCLKFRSMVNDAEHQVARLQAEHGMNALLFKLKDDPRVTRPGRFIRRYSIDELPQLFNVLFGHMSLVGPRPQVQAEVTLYDDAMRRRLHVRPGLTGLWQVSGRSTLSAEEAIRLDLYYVDNWSMLQDLSILARTFGAVVGSKGAY